MLVELCLLASFTAIRLQSLNTQFSLYGSDNVVLISVQSLYTTNEFSLNKWINPPLLLWHCNKIDSRKRINTVRDISEVRIFFPSLP